MSSSSTRPPRFSRRLPSQLAPTAFAQAVARARREGRVRWDLTLSDPTRAALPAPVDLAPLSRVDASRYEPAPLGLRSAREAVAADYARRGVAVDPEDVVLTASTSEGYSLLFKLLCDPGDAVLAPRPSYPLFDQLIALEGLRRESYALRFAGEWSLDLESAADFAALLAVSPNNPTGSFLRPEDMARLDACCTEAGAALICDEVFGDYGAEPQVSSLAGHDCEAQSFVLSGLSKVLGLPQLKLSWILLGGPKSGRPALRERLSHVADAYLSVATPVQLALPELLAQRDDYQRGLRERLARNEAALRTLTRDAPAMTVLPRPAGWYALLRLPRIHDEAWWATRLLEDAGVLVQPGWFYDFELEPMLVLSLLPEPAHFEAGVRSLVERVAAA